MRFFSAVAALVSISAVAAETFTVIVGGNGSLAYDPPSVNAKVGDIIQFQFVAKNHTVTQSTFAKPCEKMSTPTIGVDSGFQFVKPNATEFPVWSFTLNNASAPLWFYCAQQPHCSKGMVFAVNPTAEKSFDAFKANALASASGATGSTGSSGTPAGAGPSASASTTASPGGALTGGALSMSINAAGLVSFVSLITALLL